MHLALTKGNHACGIVRVPMHNRTAHLEIIKGQLVNEHLRGNVPHIQPTPQGTNHQNVAVMWTQRKRRDSHLLVFSKAGQGSNDVQGNEIDRVNPGNQNRTFADSVSLPVFGK